MKSFRYKTDNINAIRYSIFSTIYVNLDNYKFGKEMFAVNYLLNHIRYESFRNCYQQLPITSIMLTTLSTNVILDEYSFTIMISWVV